MYIYKYLKYIFVFGINNLNYNIILFLYWNDKHYENQVYINK